MLLSPSPDITAETACPARRSGHFNLLLKADEIDMDCGVTILRWRPLEV